MDDSKRGERPGKARTWWHPLLARLLDHELATAYSVWEEVLVGKLPLRVDILLVRRETGELSEASRRDLSVLVPLLNRFTLIEFKGPTDTLEPGDLAQLVGCAFLWHSQQEASIPQAEISLMVLAPSVNEAVRDEVQSFGWQIGEHKSGVHRITGGPLTMWLVETDIMAKLGQPVLSLVSRVLLSDRERIIEQLTRTGHGLLLWYVLQQIEQFRKMGKEFAMQHAGTEYMGQLEEELQTAVLETIPVEKRLRGLPPEERLRGLSPEELADGLTEEQAASLRELLEHRQKR
jgi:hypothetical protein